MLSQREQDMYSVAVRAFVQHMEFQKAPVNAPDPQGAAPVLPGRTQLQWHAIGIYPGHSILGMRRALAHRKRGRVENEMHVSAKYAFSFLGQRLPYVGWNAPAVQGPPKPR